MGRFQWLERTDSESAPQTSVPPPAALSAAALARDYLDQGNQLLLDGLYGKALREYSRALAEDNDNLEAWTWQTLCQIMKHEYAQAYTWGRKFVQLFPHEPQALALLALAASLAPETQHEVAELESQIAALRGAESTPIIDFAHTFALLATEQNNAAQSALNDFISSLTTVKEQIFWMTLSAAFLLDRRCADTACALLETLYASQTLTIYGLSLYIKAEWLRGQTNAAKKLLRHLRQLDSSAVTTYDIHSYMDHVQPQSMSGVKQYLNGLFRLFDSDSTAND